MQLFAGCGYSFKELLGFDTAVLSELFSFHTTLDAIRHNELMLYFEGGNKARNHPGFTFLYHYQQYVELAQSHLAKRSFSNIIVVSIQKKKLQ
ncbi:hypothetical protein [Sphingobacterium sp. BIGb0116]|uniref:hypothetical protein n=1 Tax=Sphingobacterium sp. BIGb0116 TaxID=2940619 RepID=UPI002167DED1|nr:hypothetical protein [Sphingobacterium sp. BIGb0116]MCS4164236.1 hypothetical protein [Sphingobacterium sp. BIGb0116]